MLRRGSTKSSAALTAAVALALTGIMASVALATPEHLGSANPNVTLDVSPTNGDNLPTPANVTVTGAGFGNAQSGDIFECTTDSLYCTNDPLALFTTDASGNFTQSVTVTRSFTSEVGPVINCGLSACMVYGQTNSGPAVAGHHISFVTSGTTPPPGGGAGTTLTATGQRAAALKKCKKKKSQKAKKKCKKKAKLLPV